MAIFGQNKKRHQYNKILLFIAFCCCSVLTQFNHACLTYTLNSSKHGNITYTTKTLLPAKSSEIALKNSGRPLTISLMTFAIYGVITGVDDTGNTAEIDVFVKNAKGEIVAPGSAVVKF